MKTCVSRPDASVDLRGCVCGHAAPFRPRAQADLVGKRPTFHSNLFFFFFWPFSAPTTFAVARGNRSSDNKVACRKK